MMARLVLACAALLLACGDSVATSTSAGSTTTGTTEPGTTTTGTTSSSSTTGEPTTSGGTTSTSSSTSTSTGTTTEGVTSTTSTTGTSTTGTSTTGTTTDSTTTDATSTTTGTTTEDSTSSSSSSSTTSTDSSTGDPDVPPPELAGQCTQGGLSTFVTPMLVAPELHIVGVYEPTNGTITVDVTRADIPMTIVLSSYEPVQFVLNLAPGVLLDHVILNGYNMHTVMGQGAAMVTDLSGGNYLSACAYVWPNGMGGCETPPLVAGAESLTGLTLTSFVGCYQAQHFSID